MLGLLSTAFGMSIASALVPLISIEVVVIGMVLQSPTLPWWLLAVVVTVGQVGGKLLYYYSAKGVIRLPAFMQRKGSRSGRWHQWLQSFRASCHDRPVWTGAVLLVSAVMSIPPYAATAIIAGWARVSLTTFVTTAFVGRFARFAALALAPGVVVAWL
ncbi:hypothetical protein GIY23_16690 [Allosaccharopolyspora coralli]|uniref:VTT domain-containing protein n=1 Tax=Allosaccharopolyspora coralli TaxID=2665642 RepID=A0A5Q3QDA0_9PSEU|nr:hypothetical protein GIY23_16690 [Allosaccharopolyspora coralli]